MTTTKHLLGYRPRDSSVAPLPQNDTNVAIYEAKKKIGLRPVFCSFAMLSLWKILGHVTGFIFFAAAAPARIVAAPFGQHFEFRALGTIENLEHGTPVKIERIG